MRKQIRNLLGCSLLTACLLSGQTMTAQSVIFPQEKQAGNASLVAERGVYTLQNDLLKAHFVVKNNHVFFNGCEQLGLLPGSELFSILLADGREVPASSMNLKSVEELNLTPAEGAAKGSLKLNGKAIEAHFTFEDLSIVWRAVLRDGSHYLRTEMDINANKDVAMRGIIAMKYSFNNKFSKQLPHVVGNTRGAVIANDKIFAGLETPMGINTVASAPTVETSVLQGLWSRQTTLQAGKTWNVGAVVGLIAKDQARRSFLAYSERERAVPWRATPVYISWYELNIDRNNSEDYSENMTINQCVYLLLVDYQYHRL